MQLFDRKEIPSLYHEPYILGGYRRPSSSAWECFKYTLNLSSNDALNFWTHFVPFWVSLALFLRASQSIDFLDVHYSPLLCLWAGTLAYLLCSSVAHLFACMAEEVRHVCFMIDYSGISLYAMGGCLATFYYLQSLDGLYYRFKWPLLIGDTILVVMATVVSSLSRFFWRKHRFVIRMTAYLLPYLTGVLPYASRVLAGCFWYGNDCIETLHGHLLGNIFSLAMAFFYVTKIPERFYPGKFDTVCQSHQLFHLCAFGLSFVHMSVCPRDATLRAGELSLGDPRRPDFSSTILLFGMALCGCLVCVCVIGYLVFKGHVRLTESKKVE